MNAAGKVERSEVTARPGDLFADHGGRVYEVVGFGENETTWQEMAVLRPVKPRPHDDRLSMVTLYRFILAYRKVERDAVPGL